MKRIAFSALALFAAATIARADGTTAASSSAAAQAGPSAPAGVIAQVGATLAPASQRFSDSQTAEVPHFQRHVLPLMGRLGCNGRACHGSFQGQGGFRLSLFGYDFKMDHDALAAGDEPRINLKKARESLFLTKPTSDDKDEHGGGKRMDLDSWQYRLLLRWVEAGAQPVDEAKDPTFVRLEVTPTEIVAGKTGETTQLRVISHWSNGVAEDVTPLCRFLTNDESVAKSNETGLVTVVGKGDTHIVAFYDNGVLPVPVLLPVSDAVGPHYPPVPTPTKVDELVVNKLRKLGVVPSELSTDAQFLRRVSLDMTGTLPSSEEVTAFAADTRANKRDLKIDELLERPAYAAWWATKLCDTTGNNERNMPEQSYRTQYAEQWYRWMYRRVKENTPYDKVVEGLVMSTSKVRDQSYLQYTQDMGSYVRKKDPHDFSTRETMPHYWSRNNMRTENEKALSFSYAFLGVRLQCAECHKHPFDQWSQQDFQQFTAFFTRIKFGIASEDQDVEKQMVAALGGKKGENGNKLSKEFPRFIADGKDVPFRELYVTNSTSSGRSKGDKKKPIKSGRVITPKVLGGEEVIATNYNDPRQPLMDWLRQEDNPYFARAFVNRVWAGYFNVGIVEPPDDMNMANAPSNRELLDYLADAFVRHNYDMKWLHREITRSRTYQLSWKPNATNELDMRNFSHSAPRRLQAEVVYDAVISATAGTNLLAKRQQDPAEECAIGVFKGYTQGAGRNTKVGYALGVFGKPRRETTCDCERSNEPTLLQTIFMRNDDEVLAMIERPDAWLAETTRRATSPHEQKLAKASERVAELAEEVEGMEDRLARAKKRGDKDTVKEMVGRLKESEENLRQAKKNRDRLKAEIKNSGQARLAEADEARLIGQIYLRTLSRQPSAEEAANARTYLAEAESSTAGLRDLLWALLNTKEFVVNH